MSAVTSLSGAVTLEVSPQLFQNGLTFPNGISELAVDWSKVDAVDSSAISLMLAWQRAAQRQNVQLRFINLPENLLSLADLYGVTELLALQ